MNLSEDVLSISPLLAGTNVEEVRDLLDVAEVRSYRPGELIVEEGTPSDGLFVLKQGTVQVEKAGGVVLAILQERGDFFGEMSLIDILPRSASIRARDEVEVFAFPKRALSALFTALPRVQMTMILNIARNLSLRLREADTQIVELSRALEAERKK